MLLKLNSWIILSFFLGTKTLVDSSGDSVVTFNPKWLDNLDGHGWSDDDLHVPVFPNGQSSSCGIGR